MVNTAIFSTQHKHKAPSYDTVNSAGGKAYKLSDENALAQYVVTSCFNDVYYASGKEQLQAVQELCSRVRPEIIAKAAVYAAENGGMKDTPALLLAVLASKNETDLFKKVFARVIKSPKMLFNFVQMVRSGITGRRSFGTAIKKEINKWINQRGGDSLFLASLGQSCPSLVDVIKMTHPKPKDIEQETLFAYLIGADHAYGKLPPLVKEFEMFKHDNTNPMPNIDYRALTNCYLTQDHWKQIAKNMPWNTLRINLNNLGKNGVFLCDDTVDMVANKISDADEVRKWNVFPYQLLTAFLNTNEEIVPRKIKLALQDAMEIATENVPSLGKVAVCVDVSGSMGSPITGNRRRSSKTSCRDVAALIAACIARTNPEADIISFGTYSRYVPNFNPRDSVMSNARKLQGEANYCNHGTEAAAAMREIIKSGKSYDMIVFLTDCQSWVDTNYTNPHYHTGMGSGLANCWEEYKKGNPDTKVAEVNLQPYGNSQLSNSDSNIMNIGGWSDAVFDVLKDFVNRKENSSFINVIEEVEL